MQRKSIRTARRRSSSVRKNFQLIIKSGLPRGIPGQGQRLYIRNQLLSSSPVTQQAHSILSGSVVRAHQRHKTRLALTRIGAALHPAHNADFLSPSSLRRSELGGFLNAQDVPALRRQYGDEFAKMKVGPAMLLRVNRVNRSPAHHTP
eukprot:1796047-Pyramimonas_sp.AAC.1